MPLARSFGYEDVRFVATAKSNLGFILGNPDSQPRGSRGEPSISSPLLDVFGLHTIFLQGKVALASLLVCPGCIWLCCWLVDKLATNRARRSKHRPVAAVRSHQLLTYQAA